MTVPEREVICTVVRGRGLDYQDIFALYDEDGELLEFRNWSPITSPEGYRPHGCTAIRHRVLWTVGEDFTRYVDPATQELIWPEDIDLSKLATDWDEAHRNFVDDR